MLTLAPQELTAITGRKQAAAQISWLARHDWVFAVGSDGLPKVARGYFERRMVSGDTGAEARGHRTGQGQWQINSDAIRRPGKK